jgi:hypothetical protein
MPLNSSEAWQVSVSSELLAECSYPCVQVAKQVSSKTAELQLELTPSPLGALYVQGFLLQVGVSPEPPALV